MWKTLKKNNRNLPRPSSSFPAGLLIQPTDPIEDLTNWVLENLFWPTSSRDDHILHAQHTNTNPNRRPTQRRTPSAYQTHPFSISMTSGHPTDSIWVSTSLSISQTPLSRNAVGSVKPVLKTSLLCLLASNMVPSALVPLHDQYTLNSGRGCSYGCRRNRSQVNAVPSIKYTLNWIESPL